MVDETSRQFHLADRTEAQPGLGSQLDHQAGRGAGLQDLHLDKGRGRVGPSLAMAPGAEGGVGETLLAGKGGGAQAALLKRGQEGSALREWSARTSPTHPDW